MKCQKSKIFEHVRNLRFQTRSQITLFIVFGLFLLVILGLIFSLAGRLNIFSSSDESNVKSFAEDCFKIAQICMLERAGENGAYSSFDYGLSPLNKAKEELENNIAKAAEICQDNFKDLKGLKIQSEKPNVELRFNKQDTTANIKQKITITKGEKTTIIDQFLIKADVRFSETYSLAEKFMEENDVSIGNDYINAKLLEQNDFNINVYETGNNQLITVTDDLSRIKGASKYKFSFVK